MENLAGDLFFVQLPILPTLSIHFVQDGLGELRSGVNQNILKLKGVCAINKKNLVSVILIYLQLNWPCW